MHAPMKPAHGPPAHAPEASARHEPEGIVVRPRTLWLAAAIAVGLLALGFVVAHALDTLTALFIGIVLAEGLRPMVARLSKSFLPRPLAVLLLYVIIIGAIGVLCWLLLRPLLLQLTDLVNHAPAYIAQAQHIIAELRDRVGQNPQATALLNALSGQAGGLARQLLPTVLHFPLFLVGALFEIIQILLIAFFWLTAIDELKGFVLGLLPTQARPAAAEAIAETSHKLGGYVRGVVINMIVIGALSSGGLLLIGVPYPALLGVLAGLTETLPFIGPWIGGTPAVLIALVSMGPIKAVEVIILYVVIQQIEGNTLVPFVMNRTVDLNPLTVIVAVLFGGAIFGIVGAVLGVPAAVLIQVLVVRILAPAARRAAARASE